MGRTLAPDNQLRPSVILAGVGAVTGHGVGSWTLVDAVLAAKTSVRPVTRFSTEGLCSALGAEAPPEDVLREAAGALAPREGGASRAGWLTLAAAAEAVGTRDFTSLAPSTRRGVIVGSTKGALELGLACWREGRSVGVDFLGEPARVLAAAVRAQGPVLTVSAACASSLSAVGEGISLIESGVCDEVFVAGVDALHAFIFQGFHALKALSPRVAMPFDVARAGLSLGEGAGVLWLTREGLAAPIVKISGFGASTDAYDQTAPDPSAQGLLRACRLALARAERTAQDVGRYHAHGTGTIQNDAMEATMHAALFGGRAESVPVCGIKGSTGHTLGGAGALDLVVCALTLGREVLPPVVQLARVDPKAKVPAVIAQPRSDARPIALIGSAGFGGLNAAVVLERGLS